MDNIKETKKTKGKVNSRKSSGAGDHEYVRD